MKSRHRPAKVKKHERRVYLAASLFPECPDYLLSNAKQTRSLLTKTKFDKDGFRIISKEALSESEWNFSGITSGVEAERASKYEYLRECKSTYDFQIQALTELHSHEEWLAARDELSRKWPSYKQGLFAGHPAWHFFPQPFVCLPADLREKMRFEVTPCFYADDFIAPSDLIRKLITHAEPVSDFLWKRFSSKAKRALSCRAATEPKKTAVLVDEFNEILNAGRIYSAQRFADAEVKLSPETIALESQKPKYCGLKRLNRLLLEDAYPRELKRNRKNDSVVRELDEEDFLDVKGLVDSTPAGSLRTITCHRLVIEWDVKGIDGIKQDLLKWLGAIKSPSLKKAKGRAHDLIAEDELAQLSAWRARRAGLLDVSEYNALMEAAGVHPKELRGFVRQYNDPSAYRTAGERAGKRIAKLRTPLNSEKS